MDLLASVHEWFANMTNKELMFQYLPIHELTMTKLRDQIDELKKAHEMKSTGKRKCNLKEAGANSRNTLDN